MVQKYGGSSVADVDKIGRVADAVVATRGAGHDVVVVVSAMGKTTDQLLALARQIDEHPPRRELDMLLTTGERVTMALLSMAIQKRGFDAISFTGSQSGLITNDRHFDAKIIEVRPHRIEDELARGRIVIVAGYQGMSYKREITTLGRGGSDTTALALAASLGAERAEIYSDVDGVYSADPRVVANATHLEELAYDQMQAMSTAGAKVLHAGAVEFARKAKITIHARATFAPGRETRIDEGGDEKARAIVGQKGISRVSIEGDEQRLDAVLQETVSHGVSVRDVEYGPTGGAFHVVTALSPSWGKARAALESATTEGVSVSDGLGFATVVGRDLVVGRAMEALRNAGVRPLRMSNAPMTCTFLLAEADVDGAVRALHDAFVNSSTD